jgi:hypothetical protein
MRQRRDSSELWKKERTRFALLLYSIAARDEEGTMAEPQKQPQQVQIKADEKELLGQYANLAVIHHTMEEFTINFIYVFPTVPQGKLVASMIVSPMHAKRLMRAMQENVTRYEAQFGTIQEGPTPDPTVGFVQ